jgi:predicted site-specific integrase-resolvase
MTIDYIPRQILLDELNINTNTLDKYVNDGYINKYKIHHKVWFKLSEIEKMFRNHKVRVSQNNG